MLGLRDEGVGATRDRLVSRFRSSGSNGHRIVKLCFDTWRISWLVDRYYSRSRLRHPCRYRRETDERGARRFAKRWKIAFPE